MFFKKEKEQSNLPRSLLSFLNEADNAYMLAFETKATSRLRKWFGPNACIYITNAVHTDCFRFFATDKFRKTKWTNTGGDDVDFTLMKEVVFDTAKLSKGYNVKIGQDYTELWHILVINGQYVVESVEAA